MLSLIPICLLLAFAQAPAGWNDTLTRASRLLLQGKSVEAIALYEKAVQASPSFDAAHYGLAEAHLVAADALKPQGASQAAARRRHLEAAAVHYRRAIDLGSGQNLMAMASLVTVYGKDGLNRLSEAEAFARQLVQAHPSTVVWHVKLAGLLFDQGRLAEGTDVLHKAPTVLQGGDRIVFGLTLTNTVVERPELSASLARILLEDARTLADQELKSQPQNRDLLMIKSAALELLATRVEQDPKRREALKKEASSAFDRFHEAGLRESGIPTEWAPAQNRANELAGQGKHKESADVYQKFLKDHPNFAPAHVALGMAYLTAAPPPNDRSATAATERTRYYELARAAYQRAIDVARPSDELPDGFLMLAMLYSPGEMNRPAEREALLQNGIKKYPADPESHMALIRDRVWAGNAAAVDALITNARAAVAKTYHRRLAIGRGLYQIGSSPDVGVPMASKLLAAAVVALDEALKLEPNGADALWLKSEVLKEQARRKKDP